ncbi:MAG TPA: hypothetical protein VMJ35_14180 [Dongiaceae bacterium]|nr:hypothetical protein [Dongiaceae bacterium]
MAQTFQLVLLVMLGGCHSQEKNQQPTIEFTKIPPAAQGGRERTDTISGRVSGARPGQRIVVYARSGPWWVQPWPDQPYITVKADSTWSTMTHLGWEYAAALVNPEYRAAPTLDVAPSAGGAIAAVSIAKGVGSLSTQYDTVHFSGYDWLVRKISSDRGGMNNLYDGDNAWTDAGGALHMRIKKNGDKWSCTEMKLTRSLGYGTYVVTLRDTSNLEPAAVLSLNTFDDWGGDQHYREMDVEVSRWGDAANKTNARYAVQPFYMPGNMFAFAEPQGTLTHFFRWEPGKISFKTLRGSTRNTAAPVVAEHIFTSGVPSSGTETFQLILYVVASEKNPMEKGAEVIVEKFEYLP